MEEKDHPLIAQAKADLSINVPIYRIEVKGSTVTFYLYGHTEPVTWTAPKAKRKRASKATA